MTEYVRDGKTTMARPRWRDHDGKTTTALPAVTLDQFSAAALIVPKIQT